jgi:hypothetical protein
LQSDGVRHVLWIELQRIADQMAAQVDAPVCIRGLEFVGEAASANRKQEKQRQTGDGPIDSQCLHNSAATT